MNTDSRNPHHPELDEPLESAVWAVISTPLPGDALERVKQRAKAAAKDTAKEGQPSVSPAPNEPAIQPVSRRWSRPLVRLGAPLVLASSLLLVVSLTWWTPNVSLAQIIEASLKKPWVHAVSSWSQQGASKRGSDQPPADLRQVFVTESWHNQELGITATKRSGSILFRDNRSNESINYKVGSESVVKTLPVPSEIVAVDSSMSPAEQLQAVLAKKTSVGRYTSSNAVMNAVLVNGRKLMEAAFEVQLAGDPLSKQACTVVFDPETNLLVSMSQTFQDGGRCDTVFDYPETGPIDMFAAGVPETVKVVDRRASMNIETLDNRSSTARLQFDDYDAIVVDVPEGLDYSLTSRLNTVIQRVRRNGNRCRIDTLLAVKEPISSPASDVDLDLWWKTNRDKYWSVPSMICDGENVTYYQMADGHIPGDAAPNLEVVVRNTHPVHRSGVDVELPWPDLMPEQVARPRLYLHDPQRVFEYSTAPDDGPEGTARLVVTMPDVDTPEVHRYWLDPNVELSLRRVVQPVFHSKMTDPAQAGRVAYYDSQEILDYRKSPSGYWYPTRVERQTTQSDRKQIRTFHVDFDVELDETLFTQPETVTSPH